MRTLLTIAFMSVVPLATAAETCSDLATALHIIEPSFSEPTGTPEQLFTWRASCAEEPPAGAGDVVLLCEAGSDTGRVFYWLKNDQAVWTVGHSACS